jgi:hypothetical protein
LPRLDDAIGEGDRRDGTGIRSIGALGVEQPAMSGPPFISRHG